MPDPATAAAPAAESPKQAAPVAVTAPAAAVVTTKVSVPVPSPPDLRIPLADFVAREMKRTRSAELLGAFKYQELAAGRSHDTLDAYRTRFAAVGSQKA